MTLIIALGMLALLCSLALVLVLRPEPVRRPMRARGAAPIRGDEVLARKMAIATALRESVQRRGLMQVRMPGQGEERGGFELAYGGRGSFRVVREGRRGGDYFVELETLVEAARADDEGPVIRAA